MAITYDGKERRNVDYIEALINGVKELVNVRLDALEKRLDQIEKDITDRLQQGEDRIKNIEEAPAKKAQELQKGFFKSGQDMAIKGAWTIIFGFLGFLVLHYLNILK